MGSYSSTTGYISLYAGGGWEDVTFPAISDVPSSESFSRFKVTKSNTLSYIEIENSAGTQTLSFDTWYSTYSYINSSFSAPKIKARNTGSSTLTTTFTLTVETTVSSHSITVNTSPAGGGTATASANSAASGATITITCSPSTGYSANTPTATGITFTSAGTNKWTFTMPNSAVTVSCTFTQVNYTVTVGVSPSGSGTLTRDKSTAHYGDTVTLTRSATAGWQFSSWTKDPTSLSINNNLQFSMPAQNVSVTAVFTKINYTVSRTDGTGGTSTLSKTTANVGDTITVTCTPSTGYSANTPTATNITFTSAGTNKWTFTMPAGNVAVSCTYSKVSYTVSKTEGTGGTGTLSATSANYGATITVTASPSTGYSANTPTASGVTFTSTGTNTWTFSMPASNVTVAFTFTQINYSVTVGVSPSGSGTLTRDKSTAHYGDTVTLTRSAGTGWQFSSWTTVPNNLSINSSTLKFTMPAQNVSVTANFTKIAYNVTKTDGTGGSSTLSKTSANYQDTVTITLSPSAGYTANTPTATGITFTSAGTNKWSFTMPASAVAISCTFSAITYTITKSASPSGAGTVTTGANSGTVGQQITVSQTPATGYYFNGWTITPNTVSVSSGKITMPASNVTIVANYLKRSTATLSSSSMTGNGTVTLNIVADKTTYSHKYKLSFGTNMETSLTAVAAGTTQVSISVPDGWANYIPNATSKTGGTLLLETYNGSTKIGDYTISNLTYNVRANANPSIGTITTGIVRTVGGTTYANVGDVYVQNKCAVRIQTTGSGALSSTVTKMETSISGYTANAYKNTVNTASVDFTSGLLTVSGTATITVKVTDSRGRTATKTATITVSAYNSPTGSLTVLRVNSGRTADPLGTYATYSLSKSYTAVGNNSLAWSITSQNTTANSPADTGDLLPSSRQTFSQTSEYTIRMTLQDSFETVHIDTKLPTARFFLYCNGAGDRMGIMGASNESLSKNGKSTVTQFSGDTQLYYGNSKFEDYFALNSQIAKVKNFGMAQIQASLVNPVTISAGDAGKIFDNVNLKTGNVLTSFAIGTQADIPDKVTGISLLWASGGNCLPNDQIAWSDGAVTLGVKNVGSTSATLSTVRLLLFGTYN